MAKRSMLMLEFRGSEGALTAARRNLVARQVNLARDDITRDDITRLTSVLLSIHIFRGR
jgi:hypothetical protein